MNRMLLATALTLLAPAEVLAQSNDSHASIDAELELPDGRDVGMHAETDDPSRAIVLRVRVPPPAPEPPSFETAYVTSLAGYSVSALIGAGLGMLLAWGAGGEDATRIVSGGLVGAAFTGVIGCGIALGQLRGGPPNAAIWPTIFAPFASWVASALGAFGLLARPDPDVLAASLIAFGASVVVAPLVSALIYRAAPATRLAPSAQVRVGPGVVYGVF